jgi:glutaredoxin
MIRVYTTNSCAFCALVKKYLKSRGHIYEEYNMDISPGYRKEAYDISGALTVPITVIGKEVIVGWQLPKINAALQTIA